MGRREHTSTLLPPVLVLQVYSSLARPGDLPATPGVLFISQVLQPLGLWRAFHRASVPRTKNAKRPSEVCRGGRAGGPGLLTRLLLAV